MATVALADDCVITGCIRNSQRQGDINYSDARPDQLQAPNIKGVLELKGFDLGLVSSHGARGGRKL